MVYVLLAISIMFTAHLLFSFAARERESDEHAELNGYAKDDNAVLLAAKYGLTLINDDGIAYVPNMDDYKKIAFRDGSVKTLSQIKIERDNRRKDEVTSTEIVEIQRDALYKERQSREMLQATRAANRRLVNAKRVDRDTVEDAIRKGYPHWTEAQVQRALERGKKR